MKHVNTCDRVVMNAKSVRTVGATANKKTIARLPTDE